MYEQYLTPVQRSQARNAKMAHDVRPVVGRTTDRVSLQRHCLDTSESLQRPQVLRAAKEIARKRERYYPRKRLQGLEREDVVVAEEKAGCL